MKKSRIFAALLCFLGVSIFLMQPLPAQGYGGALTFQGVGNTILHSAGSRSMGGVSIGARQDIGLMFQNPAALRSIRSIQVLVGGLYFSKDLEQDQEFAPVRYYPNLSLLLEGRTTHIPDPDTTLFGFTAQDTVQRPYDDIRPDWSRSNDDNMPIQAFLAVPVKLGSVQFIGGIGAVEYANLDHYYQNNNVLSPEILTQRPYPILRPTDNDPLEVDWLQTVRMREGSIQAYGFSLAANVEKINLSIGFSGMTLDGNSDDFEQTVGRGNLTFYSNAFRIDSVYGKITKTGTSDYSGQEFTISSIISGRFVSIGISAKLPMTLKRTYSMRVAADTTGTSSISTVAGEDKLKIPLHGIVGFSLTPNDKLRIGLEWEYRPFGKVKYTDADGVETSPWLSASLFRVGAEYKIAPWLALRGGMRGQAEVFEPVGNKIEGDPVTYTVYSAGAGVLYSGLHLNVAYENSLVKYQDVWSGAISRNSERRHVIVADLSYEIPRIW